MKCFNSFNAALTKIREIFSSFCVINMLVYLFVPISGSLWECGPKGGQSSRSSDTQNLPTVPDDWWELLGTGFIASVVVHWRGESDQLKYRVFHFCVGSFCSI